MTFGPLIHTAEIPIVLPRLQVPAILGDIEDPMAATIGGVACLTTLVGYCVYQVRQTQ